ncbi:MAG: hypothetical protein AB1627_16100 [Chloroflexota bacterium]
MTQSASRPGLAAALVVVLSLALAVAACGGSAASPGPTGAPASAPTAAASPEAPMTAPEPTEVPGGASVTPDPLPDDTSTTETEWGTILDAVPATFPVLPGAEPVESPDEPVSGAWISGTSVDEAAAWYRGELEALGLSTLGLSDPLEDGSRVLDTVADIPECRIQTTFRPAGESTMITVLYAAGCAGGDG